MYTSLVYIFYYTIFRYIFYKKGETINLSITHISNARTQNRTGRSLRKRVFETRALPLCHPGIYYIITDNNLFKLFTLHEFMSDPVGILNEKISEISKRVKSKQGEMVLCFRDFSIPSDNIGCFPSPSHDFSQYEAGIIDGETQKLSEMKIQAIPLEKGVLILKAHHYMSYTAIGDHVIPVDRRLDGFISYFGNSFTFDIEELENLRQGEILIDSRGVAESTSELSRYITSREYSHKFNLLIGDEEVNQFLSEKKVQGSQDLVDILKGKSRSEAMIRDFYLEKGRSLGKSLVTTTNAIANAIEEIREMEDALMHAKYSYISSHDGGYFNWDDSHNAQVARYETLKKQIFGKREILEKQLKEAEGLYKNKKVQEPMIDLTVVGFPTTILPFEFYADTTKYKLLPQMNETLARIDTYLKEQKERD